MRKVAEIGLVDYLSINIRPMWTALKAEPACFWLLCAYMFFEYVRPQSAYPALDFLPWGKILLLGSLINCLATREPKTIKNPMTFTSIGFFIAALLSSLFAVYPEISFDRFMVFVNWLILYFLFIWIVTTKFRFFIVVLLFLLTSFKMSQHGAISWVRRGMSFQGWGISGGAGYFGNAADLGVQMLIFIPLAIAFILGCRQYWGRYKSWFFYLFPLTGVMTVMATGERGTMLGLVAMGLVVVLVGKQKLRKLFLIGIAAFAIFHVMPDQFKARFETAGKDGTSQARLKYWARGLEMYQDHSVLGIGYNNWIRYYSENYPGESLRKDHQEVAHSTPITVLAEMGTLGFVFFYGMALATIVTNIRTMRAVKGSEEKIWYFLAFGLNVGLIGFLVASSFVTEHEFPFLFVHASLSAALFGICAPRQQTKRRRRIAGRPTVTDASVKA